MSNSKTTLILYAIGLFALGAVIALSGEHLLFRRADPRDDMQTMRAFQDWRITCSARTQKDGACVLQTAIFDKGTNAPVVQLSVGQKGHDDTLAVITPLGVLIPPGLRISVGTGQPKIVPYKTCMQGGCVATLPLDSAYSTAMSANSGGQIAVVNAAGKPVALNYSLRGFKDALAARAVDMAARKGH